MQKAPGRTRERSVNLDPPEKSFFTSARYLFYKTFLVLTVTLFVGVTLPVFAKEPCRTLSVLIRLGDQKKCYLGHAGIGIDNEHYDWGPSDDSRSDFMYYTFGDKGQPYEDIRKNTDPKRKNLATTRDVRNHLMGPNNLCSAYEVQVQITEYQAYLLEYYWDFIYEKEPYFHVLKNQCANIAFSSLKYAGLLEKGRVVLLPEKLLKKVQKELVSTCGDEIGQAAKTYKLK